MYHHSYVLMQMVQIQLKNDFQQDELEIELIILNNDVFVYIVQVHQMLKQLLEEYKAK